MSEDNQKTELTGKDVDGMVLYSDGSAIPNPGFHGWGLHGYLYRDETPKKGSGNTDHILTAKGYILKAEAEVANPGIVTPLHYVDGFGSFAKSGTNNAAELYAAYYGLKHAEAYEIREVRIWTDSDYVVKGMESWVHSWKKHGWRRSNGDAVPNVEIWKMLAELRDVLVSRGVKVTIGWIKGHNDLLGNMRADRQAKIGTCHSIAGIIKNEVSIRIPDGYWKYETNVHPFISHRCLYFNTRRANAIPGEYFIGYHGKEDDQYGNRIADGAVAILQLNEPDPILELLMEHQSSVADDSDHLMKMFLDSVYKSDVHRELSTYGALAVYRPALYALEGMNREPLTREFKPVMQAYRAVENTGIVLNKLNLFKEKSPEVTITDLTPILYETVVKTGKKGTTSETILKPDYHVGYAALDVQANYNPGADSGELRQEFVRLTLGIDLLDRNGLRRLEKKNPKVSLITWMESELAFRHATVIEVDDGIGIWCGCYSNIRVISAPAA